MKTLIIALALLSASTVQAAQDDVFGGLLHALAGGVMYGQESQRQAQRRFETGPYGTPNKFVQTYTPRPSVRCTSTTNAWGTVNTVCR